jgi:phosphatidylinositol glycan class K
MNALGIYDILKANGVPDSQIILMLADEYATNARNPRKNGMYASGVTGPTWYSNETEIDFRGSDVTVQNFLDSTLGIAPRSLDSDETSNLLIYLTGHGGDQFFKFQDEEELTAQDIANLAKELFERKKFRQSLWIADTCQAFTLFDKIETPNVLALGTSLREESSYAHHSDNDLGLSVIERWTYAFLQQYSTATDQTTLERAMVAPFGNRVLGSDVGIKDDTSARKFGDVFLSEFFGSKTPPSSTSSTTQKVAESDFSVIAPMNPPPRSGKISGSQQESQPADATPSDELESQSQLEPNDPMFYSFIVAIFLAVLLCRQLEKKA